MKQDKETKAKLLESAKAEFLEKGYMKASLRNICKNAGVTTGALYFFFEDKEDLFEALTKETIEGIYQLMQGHYEEERALMGSGVLHSPEMAEHKDDFAIARSVIHQMYLQRDMVLLVLTKAQGTKYENIADVFIETSEKHYWKMAQGMQVAYPDAVVDEKFIHWLAHEQIDAFVHMITHIEDEEEAVRFISQTMIYMMSGWYGLFMNKSRLNEKEIK
ncbi:MAG: TetR/AcrR family transcriptional regulator [Lachnospiraceae bacterium]|nr:TetR/AcrR family transcriptional regulator [Lachnospiraceae bacterium]